MNNKEIMNLYNKFIKVHNQFNAVKRSSVCEIGNEKIYPAEMQVLTLLNTNQDLTITNISNKLYMTKSAASQIVKKLRLKGLIIKERKIENERIVVLEITTKGLDIINKFFKTDNEMDLLINNMSELSNMELDSIKGFLNMLDNMFENKLK